MWHLKCSFSPSLSVDTSIRVLFSRSTSEVIDWSLSCSSLFVFLAAANSAEWEAFNCCSWKLREANSGNFKTHTNNDVISYWSPRRSSPPASFTPGGGQKSTEVRAQCSAQRYFSRAAACWHGLWDAGLTAYSLQKVTQISIYKIYDSLNFFAHIPPPPASFAFPPNVLTVSMSAVWPPPQPVTCPFQPSEQAPGLPPSSSLHLSSALQFPHQTHSSVFRAARNRNVKYRTIFICEANVNLNCEVTRSYYEDYKTVLKTSDYKLPKWDTSNSQVNLSIKMKCFVSKQHYLWAYFLRLCTAVNELVSDLAEFRLSLTQLLTHCFQLMALSVV